MELRANFQEQEILSLYALPWVPSPLPGVDRRMLDRIGQEVARATTVVRYQPGSSFSAHTHDLGEEFLVLEGTFSDEHGDYPAGTYVRNPPGSQHAPFTRGGCTIFVKLRQFEPGDTTQKTLYTPQLPFQLAETPGASTLQLHRHRQEKCSLERLAPNTTLETQHYPQGAEILVLQGSFSDENGHHPHHTWLRLPPGSSHTPRTDTGCTFYRKTGHLLRPPATP